MLSKQLFSAIVDIDLSVLAKKQRIVDLIDQGCDVNAIWSGDFLLKIVMGAPRHTTGSFRLNGRCSARPDQSC